MLAFATPVWLWDSAFAGSICEWFWGMELVSYGLVATTGALLKGTWFWNVELV
jgi:hypothetical protein